MTITITSESGLVTESEASNSFNRLREKSDAFDSGVNGINADGDKVLFVITDNPSVTSPEHYLGHSSYPEYDQVVLIPTSAFDGDTYDKAGGGTGKLTLERIFAHELMHVAQYAGDGDGESMTRAEREEEATDVADQ